MNIDIERLKHDREYWDECDPSNGEATHYDDSSGDYPSFMMLKNGEWAFWSAVHDEWTGITGDEYHLCIPRPAKQQCDGFPHVGVECEVLSGNHKWEKALVIAHINVETSAGPDMGIVYQLVNDPHMVDWVIPSACRPLKSEKDRVVEAVYDRIAPNGDYVKELIEDIYDAGALKMPERG